LRVVYARCTLVSLACLGSDDVDGSIEKGWLPKPATGTRQTILDARVASSSTVPPITTTSSGNSVPTRRCRPACTSAPPPACRAPAADCLATPITSLQSVGSPLAPMTLRVVYIQKQGLVWYIIRRYGKAREYGTCSNAKRLGTHQHIRWAILHRSLIQRTSARLE
jgi:hypothetical protein